MKKLLLCLLLALAPVCALHVGGCKSTTTLEAGGVYTDPVLAQADRGILDASKAMREYISWTKANSVFLAKWPEVAALAARIEAQEKGWVKDAYFARDAYAAAVRDYLAVGGSSVVGALPPNRAKLDGALAVLTNTVQQIVAYQQAHKPTGSIEAPIKYLAADGVNTVTDYGNGHITTTLVHVTPTAYQHKP